MKKLAVLHIVNTSPKDILQRIEDLFDYESIQFSSDDCSIRSSQIPVPIINIDRRLYSKKNWLGLNPFIFITSISISAVTSSDEGVEVNVKINGKRSVIIYLTIVALTGIVASSLPILWVGILLFFLVALFTHLFIFCLCVRYLILYEIRNAINRTQDGWRP